MKNKIKLLSLICFIVAIALAIPCVSQAYSSKDEVPINYTIKINKIDSENKMNLKGSRFQLKSKDGSVVRTETTDDEGILTFGNIKTYGEGTDIYYIEEIYTPKGYILEEKETIEVDVQKTITNVVTGAYKLKISCQTLNYSTDITRYDFVPVSSKEDLKKIGTDAEVVYEGKTYRYTANTNYKLMNDIDLSGENWEPIETPISGIFNGDGHKIKNLTLAYNAAVGFQEVGLFKSFTGIVQDVTLENVTIAVPTFAPAATSVTGKSGVGAFTAYCGGGTFKNCSVSGTISSGVSNVGGLVGHSAENVIIKFQNCINNANITAYDSSASSWDTSTFNAGGLIGCAVCSLSVTDCINNGTINGNAGNVGGLVGFVRSEGYEETAIKAGYAEDGNTITLLVGNTRTDGEYDLYLEDYDLRTLNILPGGVFTVYDASLTPIEGYENVTLNEGKLKIGTVNIKFEGKDTYFVKDVTPVDGYRRIAGYIKVVVTRYWDFEEGRFRVTVDEKVIAEDKIWDEVGTNTEELDSITNTFAPDITFENVGWNNAKATFVNCSNNAEVSGFQNLGGIVGKSHVRVTMDNCTNNAKVGAYSYGKAGGMIGELAYWNKGITSELNNCTNSAIVESMGTGTGSAGGMIAQCITDVKLINCTNTGKVQASGSSGAGGMISDATGYIYIDNCLNDGEVITYEANTVNASAGGMIAKIMSKTYIYDDTGRSTDISALDKCNVTIVNSKNTGKVSGTNHLGGLTGFAEAKSLIVINCEVSGQIENEKLEIVDTHTSDKGGIAGYVSVSNVIVKDCTVDNINLHRSSSITNNTYGSTGGIIGNWCGQGSYGVQLDILNIENCSVTNSIIQTRGQSTAGIVGAAKQYSSSSGTINIKNCTVENCQVLNDEIVSTYASTAGILAMSQSINNVIIDGCTVKTNTIKGQIRGSYGGDQDTAGVIAMVQWGDNYVIKDTNVIDSHIINNSAVGDGCSNSSGIVGYAAANSQNSRLTITECNVQNSDVSTISGNCTGILAVGSAYYTPWNQDVSPIVVTNCTLTNSTLTSEAKEGACSIISGMVGYTSCNTIMADNTIDKATINMNTPDIDSGSNVAGFFGMNDYKNTFANCNISNSTLYSTGAYCSYPPGGLANIAGIAGYVCNGTTFTKCNVTNTTFTGDSVGQYAPSSANVTGIVGCIQGEGTITGCNVKDCTMSSKAYSVSNAYSSTATGLVGVCGGVTIKNSNVEDTDITGAGYAISGMAGVAVDSSKNTSITNSSVKNVTLTDIGFNASPNQYYPFPLRNIAGVMASVNNFSGSDITVDNVDVTSHAVTIGGAIGWAGTLNNLSNVTVNDFNVTNDPITDGAHGSVAGLIGDVSYVSGTDSINNCSVTNSSFVTKCHNASGLIGTINSDATIKKATVDNVTVRNTNETSTGLIGETAGLVSYTSGALSIDNSKVINSTIENKYTEGVNIYGRHAGGFVAYACNNVTINGSELKTNTILNETSGIAGGMVGIIVQNSIDQTTGETIERNLSVVDSVVDDITVTGTNNAGGIVGIANKTTISNTDVSNATVTGNSAAGIMIGLLYNRSENIVDVSDSDITNSTVSGNSSVGGVIGYNTSNVNASNMNLSGITVTNPGSCAGGIVGSCSATTTATGINITNETKITAGDNAGGVVGFTKSLDSSNITVNNSTVTSNNSCAGGVAGLVDGTAKANSATINNNTEINGITHVGGVVGLVGSSAEMKNATISNIKVTSARENAAGMVATVSSGNSLDASGTNLSNVEVRGHSNIGGIAGWAGGDITANGITANSVKVICTDEEGRSGISGGLFGGSNTIATSNTSLKDIEVSGNHVMGGLAGVGKITAKTITLNNITATMNMVDSYAGVGGLIGITNSGSSINGVIANNITLNTKGSLAGGITGILKGSISNANVSYVNINSNTTPSEVGGIVGELEGTISSSTVDHANLYGITDGRSYGDVGGIAGNAAFDGNNIDDVHVTNSIIKSNKEAGGIIATTNGNVTNSSVDGSTVEVIGEYTLDMSGGDAGGAVAATAKTVSNVTVTNTTVKSSKLAGGVVGAGIQSLTSTTVLENLTVDNNTLVGQKTGKYIAAPNLYIVDEEPNPDSTDPDSSNQNSSDSNSSNLPLGNASPLSNANVNTTSTSTSNEVQGETTSDKNSESEESKKDGETSSDVKNENEQDGGTTESTEEEANPSDTSNDLVENTATNENNTSSQDESTNENENVEG